MRPDYYKGKDGKDVTDFIVAQELGFFSGNIIKYIVRAGRKTKDPIEDLLKAKEYLERLINSIKVNKTRGNDENS